ncbi:hypothetical protein SCLCIDRAFT_979616 [Scleroderma citrinum Foug A]|uniref:Uncharacterized protein n=1 Tax=Scleroderma citrinum Foug A TaxID=1036808 RepID=A0A0C3DVD3_9AGAM|nr:hypothetical protein SCLCIDRAFT_979616 [Scleroderma citrinum Foug A]
MYVQIDSLTITLYLELYSSYISAHSCPKFSKLSFFDSLRQSVSLVTPSPYQVQKKYLQWGTLDGVVCLMLGQSVPELRMRSDRLITADVL